VKVSADLKDLQTRLGYQFVQPEILARAMTHASFSSQTRPDNQRLEFLGDRVLGLVIAETLLKEDPSAAEGILAPRYNALVRKETCAAVARELELGAVLKLGKSEMVSGGRRKDALLGDAMEAVIAAVYLDGGLEAARGLIDRCWAGRVANVETDARDPKTALQELLQARGLPPPKYDIISRDGPDHAPEFTIEAQAQTGQSAQAKAGSKRQAEQAAAKALLEIFVNE